MSATPGRSSSDASAKIESVVVGVAGITHDAQVGMCVTAESYRLSARTNSLRGYVHGPTESVFR
jgi:hypothetical protein